MIRPIERGQVPSTKFTICNARSQEEGLEVGDGENAKCHPNGNARFITHN